MKNSSLSITSRRSNLVFFFFFFFFFFFYISSNINTRTQYVGWKVVIGEEGRGGLVFFSQTRENQKNKKLNQNKNENRLSHRRTRCSSALHL